MMKKFENAEKAKSVTKNKEYKKLVKTNVNKTVYTNSHQNIWKKIACIIRNVTKSFRNNEKKSEFSKKKNYFCGSRRKKAERHEHSRKIYSLPKKNGSQLESNSKALSSQAWELQQIGKLDLQKAGLRELNRQK